MQLALITLFLAVNPGAWAMPGVQSPVFGGHAIPQMVEGVSLEPARSFYSGGYQSSRDFIPYTVHLYEHRASPDFDEPEWIPWALRSTGTEGAKRLQWADGRSCPALYGVLQAVADFSAPRFRQPRFQQIPRGAGRPAPPPVTVHGGAAIAIWGYATHSDGGRGAMMVTGNEGAIREWVDFADSQIEACWGDQPPDYARQRP